MLIVLVDFDFPFSRHFVMVTSIFSIAKWRKMEKSKPTSPTYGLFKMQIHQSQNHVTNVIVCNRDHSYWF